MFAQLCNLFGCKRLKRFLYVFLIFGVYSGHVCLRPGYIRHVLYNKALYVKTHMLLVLLHQEEDNLSYDNLKPPPRKPSRRYLD